MSTVVPFIDLVADWQPLKDEVQARIQRIFEHGQFIMGPEVIELEQRLATDVGVQHALTCSSGTMALQLALMALEIGPGDEVIVPAFTFAAPLEVVLLLGASPVLADIDPRSLTLDVGSCAALISPRTRAIIAVSLFGQPADFEKLNELAQQHGISVIEDAAQSYGATLHGRRSGSLAHIGCTSFFPTKPLGGAGEGGALFTDDPVLARRIREAREHGQSGKYRHTSLGTNGRLDSLSCAALLVSLGRIEQQVARRQSLAQHYDLLLEDVARQGLLQLPLPHVAEGGQSVYAQYSVLLEDRERVAGQLQAAGIQVAIHYPTPLHQQPAFRDRVRFACLDNSERAAQRVLCLPLYPTLRADQQQRVADSLVEALSA